MGDDEVSGNDERLDQLERRERRRGIEKTVLLAVAVALAAASLTVLIIALMRTAGW